MTLEEKDAYIAGSLMKLEPDTLRYMVADLTAEVEQLTCQKNACQQVIAERDAEVARLKVDCECHRIQAVDRGNSYQRASAEVDRLATENSIMRECLVWMQERHHGGLIRAKIDSALAATVSPCE